MRAVHHLAVAFGALVATVVIARCAAPLDGPALGRYSSRESTTIIAEARGEIREVAGKRIQVRYREPPFGSITANFEQWPTYAYTDGRTFPGPTRVPMPPITGEPAKGRGLVISRAKGPCIGCHLIPGPDVWPAGNVGPDLSVIGDRRLPDQFLFDLIWDPRRFFPDSGMPPWGTAGILSAEEIVHIVAFLQTLKGDPPFVPPAEQDPARNPNTRPRVEPYFGDNLDPTNNPAVIFAESAEPLWSERGPGGKACTDCHEGRIATAMRGVATTYPRYFATYGRIMSLEDYLPLHVAETTSRQMLGQSREHINMIMLIKMQSNGLPVNVDVTSPAARAGWERGRALYYKRVGQRNHACADCHDRQRGGGRYIGGRLLSIADAGLTRHFPHWFTVAETLWTLRHRTQFCMLPLGMNYLPADAPEYADLELYLASFDNGKPMSVPGIR